MDDIQRENQFMEMKQPTMLVSKLNLKKPFKKVLLLFHRWTKWNPMVTSTTISLFTK
jgi:hypothetical protein